MFYGNKYMSRIGKKPIDIPSGVEVKKEGNTVTVKGPKGTLTRDFLDLVEIEVKDNQIVSKPKTKEPFANALWGTYSSHLNNMVTGVSTGFVKKLFIEGVGYKIAVSGKNVVLDVGFSHEVTIPIPEGVTVEVDKGSFTVSGFDKEKVGELASKIRSTKPTEPYKGKGIRYEGERVLRKQGKKTVA